MMKFETSPRRYVDGKRRHPQKGLPFKQALSHIFNQEDYKAGANVRASIHTTKYD